MNSASSMDRKLSLDILWPILSGIVSASLAAAGAVIIFSGEILAGVIFIFLSIAALSMSAVMVCFSVRTDKLMRLSRTELWKEPLDSIRLFHSAEEGKFISAFMEADLKKNLWEENRRQAQYKALQNQINPHFLYNTLEAIRSEALIGGLESVAEMSESLAKFFRYTISNTDDFVTVADEIRNVRDYMRIQSYRFGDRMTLSLPIMENQEVLSLGIPKLILQPIVENAIIHGLEEKKEGGSIEISSSMSGTMVEIRIKDNGVGISPDDLIEMNRNLSSFSSSQRSHGGIAIYNVNNRLHLLFGGEAGLAYYSIKGIGTTAMIRIPGKKHE